MSKQSEAKETQGWVNEPKCCDNCADCQKTRKDRNAFDGDTYQHINRKCGIGWFAVKPMNSCDHHRKAR